MYFVFYFLLQKLPSDFGQYLQHNICENLILCGDNGDHQVFNIIFNTNGDLTTKIGPKWNKFCRNNQFQIGSTIRFKFMHNNYDVCHAFFLT